MAAITLVDIDTSDMCSPSPIQFNIISLPDPANDDTSLRDYMLVSRGNHQPPAFASATSKAKVVAQPLDIHEIQTVLPHSGKYASYFVGSRIISNPVLHVSTRVDPLFFALAHFQRAMSTNVAGTAKLTKWQPWEQALAGLPSPILRALNMDQNLNISGVNEVGQLGHLLDVSDMCGDDLVLCKFSEERTLKWLVIKFNRSVEAINMHLCEKRRRRVEKKTDLRGIQGGSGAFSSSFVVAEEKPTEVSEDNELIASDREVMVGSSTWSNEEEHGVKVAALQLICDYISNEWKSKVCKEVGLNDLDWLGKKKSQSTNDDVPDTAGEKRPRSSWEGTIGQDDADALLQYTQGSGGGKSSSIITPGKKSSVQGAQSVGLKKLAKVNTKGMKSLSSFFGAGARK